MASWGGYSFIINLLPIHCLASIFTGRLTAKLYIAYAPLIVLGTIEAGARTSPLHPCSCSCVGLVAAVFLACNTPLCNTKLRAVSSTFS